LPKKDKKVSKMAKKRQKYQILPNMPKIVEKDQKMPKKYYILPVHGVALVVLDIPFPA
jgi:uncharacterized protein YqcC (DUF446 family)